MRIFDQDTIAEYTVCRLERPEEVFWHFEEDD